MIQNIDNTQLGYTANTAYQGSITAAYRAVNTTTGTDGNTMITADQVSFSYFRIEASATYSSTGSIQSAADAAYDLLRGYVLDVFENQGMDTTISTGEETIDIATLTTEEAQDLISDDGYFGVEQTSDRIVDFAIGIAGNDPSRINAIMDGVQQGFNEALDAFGGWLPDISYDTYDSVNEKLNNWVNGTQSN